MTIKELMELADEAVKKFQYDDAIQYYETALEREDLTMDEIHTLLDLLSTTYNRRGLPEACIALLDRYPQPEYLSDRFAASVLKAYYNIAEFEEAERFYKYAEKVLYGKE